MADETAARSTKRREANSGVVGIAADTTAHAGLFCLINSSGYHDPTSTNAVACLGVVLTPESDQDYDNSGGANGAQNVRYEYDKQAYFDLDASNPPTVAYVGMKGFASDNHTISIDPEDGPEVGIIQSVDSGGVWILCERSIGNAALKGKYLKASTQTLAAGDALTLYDGIDVYPIQSDGGAVSATAALPTTNISAGRMITVIGVSDTDYMVFSSVVSNIDLVGDLALECKLNDGGTFVYTGSAWREVCRFVG